MDEIYVPREDSYLIQKNIKKYAKKDFIALDIGTGSGILANEASKYCNVIAVDINQNAIKYCKNKYKNNNKIKFKISNLFSNINQKFDLIIFNPPYLPEDEIKDIALTSGDGTLIINKFLKHAKEYIYYNGKILLLFSSLTNKEKVDNILKKNNYDFKLIDEEKLFFEKLYVYEISYNEIYKEYKEILDDIIKKYNLKNIEYLAKGKRGIIFKAKYNNKYISIKIKKKESEALGNIENEIKFLKLLNKYNIGPKILFSGNLFLCYEFVKGDRILDYFKNSSKEEIKEILINVINQCLKLDSLSINKFEMHNPFKHILIGKKITMIDFERCRYSENVKNVTQFLQFIIKNQDLLLNKGLNFNKEKLMKIAKEYSNNNDKEIIKKIFNDI